MNFLDGQVRQIHNVMYVPGIKTNLICVATIFDNDLKVEFLKSQCLVKDIQDLYRIVSIGTIIGGLYKMDVTKNNHQALASTTMSIEELWNQRYGNLNQNDLMLLQKKTIVESLPAIRNDHIDYEACALGKKQREEFPMHIEKTK